MVKPFQFAKVPQIIFRKGGLAALPDHIISRGRKLALVTGKNSFAGSLASERLFDDLKKKKIEFHVISIHGEPSPDDIDNSVNALNDKGIDAVAGIGGGSVIDAGKAISAMINRSESVVRFLEGVGNMEHPGSKLPFIALPTTSGTGSEATKNAVISRIGINGFKKSLRHDNFVPDLAIVDPELTLSCPPEITAASGMDCFTQLTEAYLSDKSNEYTEALALEGLKAIKLSLKRTCLDGHDIEARTGMSFAALTSGICLANAGLGVIHGFASSIGGLFDIPHGLVCGTLMAKSNEVTVRELRKKPWNNEALRKYTLLGKMFIGEREGSDDYYIDGFVDYLYILTSDLGLPLLGKYGITEKDFTVIAATTENKNNPVKLSMDNLQEILSSRCC
jgi:alcohol dehydrogenase class IV